MKYTAFVPARSGSKRLPDKNVKNLAGKPLLLWTLEACANSKYIDEVILSTDSMEYYNLACELLGEDKLTLDYRSPEEAGDKIKIFDYLKSKKNKIFGDREGAFILALPTVPLRNTLHVNKAIELFEEEKCPVFSATPYSFPTSFAFNITDEGKWKPVFTDCPMVNGNTRSQDQQEMYHPNGAIYVRSIESLQGGNLLTLYTDALPYIMTNTDSIDIDNEIDFRTAEAIITATNKH